jgi:hypothetical protein
VRPAVLVTIIAIIATMAGAEGVIIRYVIQ